MKILISLALFASAVAAFEPQAIRLPTAPMPAYETVPDIRPLFIPAAVLEELAQKSPDFAQPEPVMFVDAPLPEVEESVQPLEVSKVKVADITFDKEISAVKVADTSFLNEELSKVMVADLSFAAEEPNKVNVVDMPVVENTFQYDVVESFPAELFIPVQVVDFVNEAPSNVEPEMVAPIQVASVDVVSVPVSPVQVATMDSSQFMYDNPMLR